MAKERNIKSIVLFNFLFLLAFFFCLRIYLLFSGNLPGNFPFSEVLAGFFEDAFLASILTWLTYLTLALSKGLYFVAVFPLKFFVVITSYSNLQYVHFFRENLRLFDLEYVRNMGGLWKSTATDFRLRPGELLFLILPLLVLLILAVFIIKSRKKKISLKRALIFQSFLLLFSCLLFFPSAFLKDKEKGRAFHQNNYFVWMVRDIPQIQRLFQATKELKEMKISFQDEESVSAKLDLEHLKSEELASKNLFIKRRPFPLPEGYIWYDKSFPFIKIPKRDASLMGILSEEAASKDEDRNKKEIVRRNVVFLILEGFRSREIDLFGGPYSITPNFNRLASKGILYKNFYGHADLTAGAQLSSLASLYDTFKGVNVMRDHSHIELFSLPEILNLLGYSGFRISSWGEDFDNARIFFKLHGNLRIIGEELLPVNGEKAGRSHSDEEVMRMAVKVMDRARKPFFAFILTATNHPPYEVPQKKFELGLEKGNYGKYLNSFHYTDYALGYFFKLLRTRKYFKDTIFFIFADTGNPRLREGEDSSPREYFSHIYHIPLLIYDPLAEEGKVVEEIAAQVDIPPTVLDMLGIEIANHFVGQSLLKERFAPYYLAYHGRGVPRVFYIDESILTRFGVRSGKFQSFFNRRDGCMIRVGLKNKRKIAFRIESMLALTDWAIFNNRIWDKRLTEFYKTLYKDKSLSSSVSQK